MWLKRLLGVFSDEPSVASVPPNEAIAMARKALADGSPLEVVEALERGFSNIDQADQQTATLATDALAVAWGLGEMLAGEEHARYARIVRKIEKLSKQRTPVDVETTERPPLIVAIDNEKTKIVKRMLADGADPNVKDGGCPALTFALRFGTEMTKLLLNKGADPNGASTRGRRPLMLTRSVEVLKVLIKAGAEVSATDDRGLTAVDIALDYPAPEAVAYLESVGGVRSEPDSTSKRNPDLEGMIRQRPADEAAWLVYADWLQEQGDPRGEWIALEIEGKESRIARTYEKQIDERISVTWKNGFVDTARVEEGDESISLHLAFDRFLRLGSTLFLRELRLGLVEEGYDVLIDALSAVEHSSLEHLYVGDFDEEEVMLSWVGIGDLSKLYARTPNLKTLKLHGSELTLGQIDLPELVTFELRGMSQDVLKPIAKANWPKLERLEVWTSECDTEAITEIMPFFAGRSVPSLRHLELVNSNVADQLARALAGSNLLAQLETLSFAMGTLSDEGAEVLSDHVGHLELLDVSDCYLTGAGLEKLSACKKIIAQRQRENGDERYAMIEE